jgi:hypothetical protein
MPFGDFHKQVCTLRHLARQLQLMTANSKQLRTPIGIPNLHKMQQSVATQRQQVLLMLPKNSFDKIGLSNSSN